MTTHALTSSVVPTEDGTGRGTPLTAFNWQSGGDVRHQFREEQCPALHAGQTPAVFQATGAGAFRAGQPSLSAGDDNGSNQVVVGFTLHSGKDCVREATETETAQCIRTRPPGSIENSGTTVASDGMTVRRLTPVECLRLQGFPDDHLDLDPPLSDSAMYRMCGNAVSVPPVEWIARRIRAAHEGRAES